VVQVRRAKTAHSSCVFVLSGYAALAMVWDRSACASFSALSDARDQKWPNGETARANWVFGLTDETIATVAVVTLRHLKPVQRVTRQSVSISDLDGGKTQRVRAV